MKLKKSLKGVADAKYNSQVRAIRDKFGSVAQPIVKRLEEQRKAEKAESFQVKGTFDGPCNITSCQRPGARVFMKAENAYYCRRCALDMDGFDRRLAAAGQKPYIRFPDGVVADAENRRK